MEDWSAKQNFQSFWDIFFEGGYAGVRANPRHPRPCAAARPSPFPTVMPAAARDVPGVYHHPASKIAPRVLKAVSALSTWEEWYEVGCGRLHCALLALRQLAFCFRLKCASPFCLYIGQMGGWKKHIFFCSAKVL